MPISANVSIENCDFERVGICYHIRNDITQKNLPRSKESSKKKKKSNHNFALEKKQRIIIKSLLNLEISAKIKNDKEAYERIKKLKSCVFSIFFEKEYSNNFIQKY